MNMPGMTTMHPRHIFDWIDEVRARPSMFVGEHHPLRDLETMIHGYYTALSVHGIVEGVPSMTRHFSTWLRFRKQWSLSCGWAVAIEDNLPAGRGPLEVFLELVDEYRMLRPLTLATVVLGPQHKPTGRRVKIGFDRLMDRPDRIDIVQYSPAPIHFLRFHYGARMENGDILHTAELSAATTLVDAKAWVSDEFCVTPGDWHNTAS